MPQCTFIALDRARSEDRVSSAFLWNSFIPDKMPKNLGVGSFTRTTAS